jgi:hypothetical protein
MGCTAVVSGGALGKTRERVMSSERRADLVEVLRVDQLEGLGDATVKQARARGAEAAGYRLAQRLVREVVAERRMLAHDPPAPQLVQCRHQLGLVQVRSLPQHLEAERASDRRRTLGELPRARPELSQTRREHGSYARRARHEVPRRRRCRAERRSSGPIAVVRLRGAKVQICPQRLEREERVALAQAIQPLRDVGGDGLAFVSCRHAQERGHVGRFERTELELDQPSHLAEGDQEALRGLVVRQLVAAGGRKDEPRCARLAAAHVVEQRERLGVAPLKVVEHQHQRA